MQSSIIRPPLLQEIPVVKGENKLKGIIKATLSLELAITKTSDIHTKTAKRSKKVWP